MILFKILLVGIISSAGIYYEFDGIYRVDTLFHNGQTEISAERGHITQEAPRGYRNVYYSFPIFHLLAAETSILTSLDVHSSIFASVGFLFLFSVVFIFLFVVMLTHTLASLILLVILTMVFVGGKINSYLHSYKLETSIKSVTVTSFLVMLFGYWMHAFQSQSTSTFEYMIYAIYSGLTVDMEFADISDISVYVSSNYFEYVLDKFGYILFLFFGIVGCYIWLRDREDKYKLPFVLSMVVLFVIIYGLSLFSVRCGIPGRWFPFAYMLLAIVSALGIFKFTNIINNNVIKNMFIVTLIFIISFFMITSTTSNKDSPLYNKEHTTKVWTTTSDIYGSKTINTIFNGTLKTPNLNTISPEYNISEDVGNLYVLKESDFKYPVSIYNRSTERAIGVMLNEAIKTKISTNGNEIYDNGEVLGYLIKEECENQIKTQN